MILNQLRTHEIMAERAALSPPSLISSACELVDDDDETTTPYAGLFDDKTCEVQEQISQRMKVVAEKIPQFDDFPWECHTEVLKGVPLKHVVDNFYSKNPIRNFDKTEQETIYMEFMA